MERNPFARMTLLVHKWMPGQGVTAQTLGEAMLMEKDYWEKMTAAITNGVVKAFNG